MIRSQRSVPLTFAALAVLALFGAAGCDWSGNITIRTEDGGATPADTASEASAGDGGSGSSDASSSEASVASDVHAASDVMDGTVADVHAGHDVVTDAAPIDTPHVTDVPVVTDAGPDFMGGTACSPVGHIRACSTATTCVHVLQFCQSNSTWTPCYIQSNTCPADAGPPPDASTADVPMDAPAMSDVPADMSMDVMPDVSAPPGMMLCPCSGAWCELTIRCTTLGGNPGQQLVRQYCGGGFCTPIVPGQR